MEDDKTNNLSEDTNLENKGESDGGGEDQKTFSQEDIDKAIAKRVGEEKAKNEKAIAEAVNTALTEYDRKAKLTAEEKDKEDRAAREAESAERERSITLRERRADARETLAKKNIPTEFVDLIVDVDEGKTNANIDLLERLFNKGVEAGVASKLKGEPIEDFSKSNNETKKPKIQGAF